MQMARLARLLAWAQARVAALATARLFLLLNAQFGREVFLDRTQPLVAVRHYNRIAAVLAVELAVQAVLAVEPAVGLAHAPQAPASTVQAASCTTQTNCH